VSDNQESSLIPAADALFSRVAAILDEARGNVVRSVNSNMVLAYWLIGREIVEGVQAGDSRAEYGTRILEGLSDRLQARYGSTYSLRNLQHFRQFYSVYRSRNPIANPAGSQLTMPETGGPIANPTGSKLNEGLEPPRRPIPYLPGRDSARPFEALLREVHS
jgi:hypothetical protein